MTDRTDPERARELAAHHCLDRHRTCEGKVPLATKADANRASKALFRKTGRQAVPYKCPFGDHWHVAKAKHGQGEVDHDDEWSEAA